MPIIPSSARAMDWGADDANVSLDEAFPKRSVFGDAGKSRTGLSKLSEFGDGQELHDSNL